MAKKGEHMMKDEEMKAMMKRMGLDKPPVKKEMPTVSSRKGGSGKKR